MVNLYEYEILENGKSYKLVDYITYQFDGNLYLIIDKIDNKVILLDNNFEQFYGVENNEDVTLDFLEISKNVIEGVINMHKTLFFKFNGYTLDLKHKNNNSNLIFVSLDVLEMKDDFYKEQYLERIHEITKLNAELFLKNKLLNLTNETMWIYTPVNNNIEWFINDKSEFKLIENSIRSVKTLQDWEKFIPASNLDDFRNSFNEIFNNKSKFWEYEYNVNIYNKEYFIQVLADIERDEDNKVILMYGTIRNKTLFKNNLEKIMYQNELNKTLLNIMENLSTHSNWYNDLYKSFEIIGKTLEVDRVYYFSKDKSKFEQGYEYNQKLEWSVESVEPQIENPDLQNVPEDIVSDYVSEIKEKGIYNKIVDKIEDSSLKELLASQQIKSIIICPLIINDIEYGFIGFDDCRSERSWVDFEITFLKTIAGLISKNIENNENRIKIYKKEMDNNIIIDNISEGFCCLDDDFNIIEWNRSAENITNLSKREVQDKSFWSVFKSLINSTLFKDLKNNNTENKKYSKIYIEEIKKWFEIKTDNYSSCTVLLFKDISEEIFKNDKLLFAKIFEEYNRDMFIIFNSKLEIEWINNKFINFVKMNFEDLYKENLQKLMKEFNFSINFKKELTKLKNLNNLSIEAKVGEVNYELIIEDIKENQYKNKFILIIKDVTLFKNIEINNLLNENNNLKTLLNKNTEMHELLQNKYVQTLANKEMLCSIISHDFISPLNSLLLNIEMIENVITNNNEYEKLSKITINSKNMISKLSNDLRDIGVLNKLDKIKDENNLISISIVNYMKDRLLHYESLASNKNIKIITDFQDEIITIDSKIFEIILNNLLSNAIKFSRLNSEIFISLYADDKYVILYLKDSGPGFTEEDIKKMYKPFQTLSAKPTNKESISGLGLYMVKSMVEICNGEISFETELNKGTTFIVKIPRT